MNPSPVDLKEYFDQERIYLGTWVKVKKEKPSVIESKE